MSYLLKSAEELLEINISHIRALYDRPGTPGEKAAALAALKRFGVNPEQKPKQSGGGIPYTVKVRHRTDPHPFSFDMNVDERDGNHAIKRKAKHHAAQRHGGSPDDYDVEDTQRNWSK